jgi:hypothetical protein
MKTPSIRKPTWLVALVILALAQSACNYATQLIGGGSVLPSGTSAPGSCANKYLPAKNGATRFFTSKSGYTEQVTFSQLKDSSFDEDWQTNPVSGQKAIFTQHWKCTTAGLVMTGTSSDRFLYETNVVVPASIKPGDQWTNKYEDTLMTYTDSYTAIGEESVTVPAGTFTAMKIQLSSLAQQKSSSNPFVTNMSGFEWWAAGIGDIKSSLSYTTKTSTTQLERDLQSYSNP